MEEITRIGSTATQVMEDLKPTPKQLAYLSGLAYRQGSSYVVPVTRQQAHAEIQRLLGERKARARRRKRRKAK